jgi:predicted regulator of Ras-like GTPase activity (Roadblock/LC7/MglB family)
MVYQSLLNELCRSLSGARGALMLDVAGEVVIGSDRCDDRLKLIGAYHGIALAAARRTADRYEGGEIGHMVSRYLWGTVISQPLKDGYYFVLALAPDASIPLAVYRSGQMRARLDSEI